MTSRRVLGPVVAGLATLLLALLVTQPASAHAPSTTKMVYLGGSLCVINKSQLTANHTTGELSAFASTNVRVYTGGNCDTIDVFPPGHIAVRYDLQKWNGSAWDTCRSTGWVLNSGAWNWEVTVSNSHGPSPCGRGYYRTKGTSLVWDGSAWQGGSAESPPHPPVP
jgi:hypothetical protein